jgi:site-specific DNA-methyltransferase (adenine-specific)
MQYLKTADENSINLVLTDIPYDRCNQKDRGLRRIDKGKADFLDVCLDELISEFCRICSGSMYIFCADAQISKILSAFNDFGLTTRTGVWEKTNPSPMNGEKLWISGLEFFVFARKSKATFNEFCKKAIFKEQSVYSKEHPTQKPTRLMEKIILASSNEGDIVLDCFMGSGTTGVACVNTDRKFIGVEKDKEYFAIAKRRIEEAKRNNGQRFGMLPISA